MRPIYLSTLILFCFLIACNTQHSGQKEPNTALVSNPILGEWVLSETKISPGGPVPWSTAEYGHTYAFGLDGSYRYTDVQASENGHQGTYVVKNGQLHLRYTDADGAPQERTYLMDLEGEGLILDFVGCIEECRLKFRKIQN